MAVASQRDAVRWMGRSARHEKARRRRRASLKIRAFLAKLPPRKLFLRGISPPSRCGREKVRLRRLLRHVARSAPSTKSPPLPLAARQKPSPIRHSTFGIRHFYSALSYFQPARFHVFPPIPRNAKFQNSSHAQALYSRSRSSLRENVPRFLPPDDWTSQR